jgi:glutamate transport system permease protein
MTATQPHHPVPPSAPSAPSLVERMLTVPRPRAGELAITEELGPKGKRNVLISAIVSLGLVAYGLWWMYNRLGAPTRLYPKGQFEPILWEPFKRSETWQGLWNGLQQTLSAAGVGIISSVLIGVAMAALRHGAGRMPLALVAGAVLGVLATLTGAAWWRGTSPFDAWTISWWGYLIAATLVVLLILAPRYASTVYVEFFRACALVLLIASPFRFFGVDPWWSVVFGLTLYYSTTIAEVTRSALRSLPKGQTEAGLAIGLSESQTMTSVLLPQAIKRALPNLLTQTASLLKDTSLGFIVTFSDLLSISQRLAKANDNYLPSLIVCAAIYIAVIGLINFTATRLQRSQR